MTGRGRDVRLALAYPNGTRSESIIIADVENADTRTPVKVVAWLTCDLGHEHEVAEAYLRHWELAPGR